jgi:hypothetical protein
MIKELHNEKLQNLYSLQNTVKDYDWEIKENKICTTSNTHARKVNS